MSNVTHTATARRSQIFSQRYLQETDYKTDLILVAVAFLVTTAGNIGVGVPISRLAAWSFWRAEWPTILASIAGGLAWQLFWQRRQFASGGNKLSAKYLTALAATVIPSCYTYWPIIVPWLAVPLTQIGAGAVVLAVLVGIDMYQEVVLVEKDGE